MGEARRWSGSAGQLHPSPAKPCSWLRIGPHPFCATAFPTILLAGQTMWPCNRHCRWGCGTERVGLGVASSFCIFLQLEPQHQPWEYFGGLLQEPGEQGGDGDAGGPGNVLIAELCSGLDVGAWGGGVLGSRFRFGVVCQGSPGPAI